MASYSFESATQIINMIDYSFMEVKPTGLNKGNAPRRTVTAVVTFENGTTTKQEIMNVGPDYWTDYYTVTYQAIKGQYSIASEAGNPISEIVITSEIKFTDSQNSPYSQSNSCYFSLSKEPDINGNSVTLASTTIAYHTLEVYKSSDLDKLKTDPKYTPEPVFTDKLMSKDSVTVENLEYDTQYTYILVNNNYDVANIFSFTTDKPQSFVKLMNEKG